MSLIIIITDTNCRSHTLLLLPLPLYQTCSLFLVYHLLLTSSITVNLFLPLFLILPLCLSKIVINITFPLKICPIQFLFLFSIVTKSVLFSLNVFKTYLILTLLTHLCISIFPHQHLKSLNHVHFCLPHSPHCKSV